MSAEGPAADRSAARAGTRPALRQLTGPDVPRVVELERELFGPSAWSEGMVRAELEAPGRWYVAVDGPSGGPVGYAGLWFDGDVAQVMTIGVEPAAQRGGIGARLLGALVDRARLLGATAVLLEVRVDNAPAIALYEQLGFTVLGRRRRYYQPEDVDALTMRLVLTSDGVDPG
ncbi:ribosomal protein S18-alanine N-acetyltransferase [Actinotalea sp. K2]|uniref:ribosomal protein S18-alanine N-acetyltransferase n=1 Tax=Actinotalea sp. K2 TaxID=2939438 RepID=UPI002016DA19|nr:ribosomal protein S18-alanine N-acetyltransferase [Actinotalea sp. K2]MCL3859980.1 ribosomal protein S18-alanine N-acetyltransferase [Actinotalea sp. K2]